VEDFCYSCSRPAQCQNCTRLCCKIKGVLALCLEPTMLNAYKCQCRVANAGFVILRARLVVCCSTGCRKAEPRFCHPSEGTMEKWRSAGRKPLLRLAVHGCTFSWRKHNTHQSVVSRRGSRCSKRVSQARHPRCRYLNQSCVL
jgi:hypothetical protein